jgi:acetyl-CoA decarbonylase/synthase complex subunit gamma
MKLAAKQVELSSCPSVSEDSKTRLAESSAPPIRLVTLKAGTEVKAGNEVVMFRHEKTFYNKPGLFIRYKASDGDIAAKAATADAYTVSYVGMDFTLDGFAVEADGGDFAAAVKAVRSASQRPLILIGDAATLPSGLEACSGETAMIYAADGSNWEAMTDLAAKYKAALVVKAESLDELAELTEKIKAKGVEDMVLDLGGANMAEWLARSTQVRRLAIKKNFRALGYPVIAFPGDAGDAGKESVYAAQAISKYAGFVVLDTFTPELTYALLVLRENIYTDPQKPIQVLPGIYEINNPTADSPAMVTTNFSITYFSVANEVEGSGQPAWLMVTDAEGMSVLTAWAAGKFDAERIAKAVKEFDLGSKISKKRIVLPGHVAVLSGELEEELPDWEIRVGPREAVDLPKFMKEAL